MRKWVRRFTITALAAVVITGAVRTVAFDPQKHAFVISIRPHR